MTKTEPKTISRITVTKVPAAVFERLAKEARKHGVDPDCLADVGRWSWAQHALHLDSEDSPNTIDQPVSEAAESLAGNAA